MNKVAILVLFFVLCAKASSGLADRELTFNSTTGNWGYRSLKVGMWTIIGLWSGAWFRSIEADGNTKEPLNLTGDYMWGSVYAGTGSFPVYWLGYYAANLQADRDISNPDGINWATFNVSVASAFLASSYLRIEEKDPATGEIIDTVSFGGLFAWTYNLTASQARTNPTEGIYAFVVDGHQLIGSQRGLSIQLQYILTQQAGTIDIIGGLPVYPKSVEAIITISGWNYASLSNQLSLFIALGTAEASWSSDGQFLIGSGDNQAYFRLAKFAEISGTKSPVGLVIEGGADLSATFQNADVVGQITSRYQKEASCQIIEVIFPSGADYIVYDPTMGAGESPFTTPGPGDDKGLVIGLSVAGGVLGLILIVVVLVVVCGKRNSYKNVE